MKQYNLLVTGGAGFIGSNLVKALLNDERVAFVRVLDNLSNGHRHNIEEFLSDERFEFLEGDIRDYNTVLQACKDIDLVSHQAALGSVPRSVQSPLTTNDVNITGTLNVFTAVKDLGIKRVVFAASSSTYGDSQASPKREDVTGEPISPYAVTKLVNELYARVYGKLYGMKYIGLRYFNVFGPKQDPHGAYAAVIPLFMKAILENQAPHIHGDGLQSRDFTYVANAVQANLQALFIEREDALNEIYNIACGEQTTVLDLYNYLAEIAGSELKPIHGPNRAGDVKHSLADISKAKNYLQYNPGYSVREGLELVFEWYKDHFRYNPQTIG
ncbi:MAG: SDR family oxidoreductase [Saprospiraceae bacterium]|nr:SDR family oxidoreductase [Saprospiraceae bacterium]